jgi:hypothetical protein
MKNLQLHLSNDEILEVLIPKPDFQINISNSNMEPNHVRCSTEIVNKFCSHLQIHSDYNTVKIENHARK